MLPRASPPFLPTIAVDFDGTVTEEDMLDRIALEFGDAEAFAEIDEALESGRLGLHEVIRREYEPITATLDEVLAWALPRTRLRAGFAELVAIAGERGWRLVVVSSGFAELIEPMLARAGLADVELIANNVEPGASGWQAVFRDGAACPACGEPCKRRTVERHVLPTDGQPLVYIGDGNSDRCAALVADLVFARAGLARHLTRMGVPHEPFEDFFTVAHTILTRSS